MTVEAGTAVAGDDREGIPDRWPQGMLLAANVVSIAGNSFTLVGVPWFVLQTTGSAAHAGIVAFASTAPLVLAALLGGPLIDLLGQLRASVVSDVVCAVAIAAVPVLHATVGLAFWELLALVAVAGLFHAPGETAREVLMPVLAERAGTPLARASSAYDGASRGARMLGAPLAGLLIAVAGPTDALLVDAATFAVSAALVVLGVRRAAPRTAPAERVTLRGYQRDLREGFGHLLRTSVLLTIVLMVMVTNALDEAWFAVLLPVDAREHLGGTFQLGLVSGVFGGAALLGALVYGAWGHRVSRRAVFIGAFFVCGFPRTAVAALLPGLTPLLVTCAVCGLAAGMLNPIIGTLLVELVPERLRSRVFGVVFAGSVAAIPLGGLFAGYLVQRSGLVAGLLTVSGVYLLATLAPLAIPTFRHMDTGLPHPIEEAPPGSETTDPGGGAGAPPPGSDVPSVN